MSESLTVLPGSTTSATPFKRCITAYFLTPSIFSSLDATAPSQLPHIMPLTGTKETLPALSAVTHASQGPFSDSLQALQTMALANAFSSLPQPSQPSSFLAALSPSLQSPQPSFLAAFSSSHFSSSPQQAFF